MYAFEIIVNGHHIQTVSAGELGMISIDLMAHRIKQVGGTIADEIRLWPHGMEGGADGDCIGWQESFLKAGDTVTIRIVDTEEGTDPPSEKTPLAELKQRRHRRER